MDFYVQRESWTEASVPEVCAFHWLFSPPSPKEMGHIPRIYQANSRPTAGVSQDSTLSYLKHIWHISGKNQVYLSSISGISQEYLRYISGISQAFIRLISGISQVYMKAISTTHTRTFFPSRECQYFPQNPNIQATPRGLNKIFTHS